MSKGLIYPYADRNYFLSAVEIEDNIVTNGGHRRHTQTPDDSVHLALCWVLPDRHQKVGSDFRNQSLAGQRSSCTLPKK
ncbi:MAG: hypothetical protein IPL46_02635 [Saprospiraceae bacterium]|nr:hypothetical protein [Saprospiraceae bacterium]